MATTLRISANSYGVQNNSGNNTGFYSGLNYTFPDKIDSKPSHLTSIKDVDDCLSEEKVVHNIIDNNSCVNEIHRKLEVVRKWKDSWTEHGLERPNSITISHAENLMESLLELVVSKGNIWLDPIISGDGDGNVSVIWHKQERELHLKIGADDVHYFKVWGVNIDTEMEVDFLKKDHFPNLWEWLINE